MCNIIFISLFIFYSITTSFGDQICVTTLSDEQKTEIVTFHNNLRNLVASNIHNENFPQSFPTYPTASNMNKLTWDDELAKEAEIYAKMSIQKLSGSDQIYQEVGENYIIMNKQKTSIIDAGDHNYTSLIAGWFNEAQLFHGNLTSYAKEDLTLTERTSHFTQIVWAATSEIGCGIMDCVESTNFKKKTYYTQNFAFFCLYKTAGNIDGQTVYHIGPVCSECKKCSDEFPGLCENI